MGQMEKKERPAPEKPVAAPPARSGLEHLPSRLIDRLEHLLGRWEPWSGLGMGKWPEELVGRPPATDLYQEGDDLVVETELPGMRKEDLELTLSGDVLTISGKREQEHKEQRRDYFRLERATSSVTRTIRLPAEVQADKMTARLEHGVLVIRAPRRVVEAKPNGTRIPVS